MFLYMSISATMVHTMHLISMNSLWVD